MKDLAAHIIESKAAHFDPEQFDDRYEEAVAELLKSKQAGKSMKDESSEKASNVVNLMDALKRSVSAEKAGSVNKKAGPAKKPAAKSMSAKKARCQSEGAQGRLSPDELCCVGECHGRRIVGDESQDGSDPSQARHQAKIVRFSRRLPGEAQLLRHERAEGET
jgi:hypothetical protein